MRFSKIRICLLSLVPILITFLFANLSFGHQDTVIPLSETGKLDRLPAKYQPSSLTIIPDTSRTGTSLRVTLRIGSHRVELPPCLSRLFEFPSKDRIRVSASWYHDSSLSGLPPYLNIELPQHANAPEPPFDYSLLFDLDTGALIHVQRETHVQQHSSFLEDVQLRSFCRKSEIDQMKPQAAK